MALFSGHDVIAVQPAGLEHAESKINPFLGNGFLKGKVFGERLHMPYLCF